MRRFIISIIVFCKSFLLFLRPHVLFGWLIKPLKTWSNILSVSKWISQQDTSQLFFNDFYSPKRDLAKRYLVYESVKSNLNLASEGINYLEFGVCGANSFKWWLRQNTHGDSKFYGFDTFEGLPEDWATFSKGEMSANIPDVNDARVTFLKGLFQDTLPGFLKENKLSESKRNIIHLDADLFSSTLYVLTSLHPYLKKGDIILFDEFNVPNHEFLAFKMYCDSYYIKPKLIAAANNYFEVAFIIA